MEWTVWHKPVYNRKKKMWIVREVAPDGAETLHEYITRAEAQEGMKQGFIDAVLKKQ